MAAKWKYGIVIEAGKPGGNYSAYVPDLPGCVTTGRSIDEVKANMVEAIQLHLYGMRVDGEPVRTPASRVEYVEVPASAEAWAQDVTPPE